MANDHAQRDTHYLGAAAEFADALVRLTRVYEADPDLRREAAYGLRAAPGTVARCDMR